MGTASMQHINKAVLLQRNKGTNRISKDVPTVLADRFKLIQMQNKGKIHHGNFKQ
jgi:hypothetical protein